MVLLAYFYIGLLGACIGSFLGVVIHRLPLGESIVRPRSHCVQCGTQIPWYHNIPVWSYLWLRGRCATCQAVIPCSYVLIELGTGPAFVGLFHLFGWSGLLLRYAVLAGLLIVAAEIDRKHGIIPNKLVGVGLVLGMLVVFATDAAGLGTSMLAALAASGLLFVVRIGSHLVLGRPGLGMGDVKLAGVMGLFLGWNVLWVFYLAVVLGGLLGFLGIATGRLGRTTLLPFAPFLALGTGLYLTVVPPSLFLPL